MKRVKCKNYLGVWYYKKIVPNVYNDYDAPVYELYNEDKDFVGTFGSYFEMKYYIEYGEYL